MKKSSYIIALKLDENGNRIFKHVCAVFEREVTRNDQWDIMSWFEGVPEWLGDNASIFTNGEYQVDDTIYVYSYNLTTEI